MVVLGIDIGITGAIALTVNGDLRDVADLPAVVHRVGKDGREHRRLDDRALAALLKGWRASIGPDAELAVLEEPFVTDLNHRGSVLSLGDSFGVCRGVLGALGVRYEAVRPRDWKAAMGLTADKEQARAMASQLFPAHADAFRRVKDHNRCEAALLAAYGWRERG